MPEHIFEGIDARAVGLEVHSGQIGNEREITPERSAHQYRSQLFHLGAAMAQRDRLMHAEQPVADSQKSDVVFDFTAIKGVEERR